MNNVELEQKINEIISMPNYFDMIMAAKQFESTYKTTDFYKATRISLDKVLVDYRWNKRISFEYLNNSIQQLLNGLDISHLENLTDKIGEMFTNENATILKELEQVKDIIGK